MDFRNTASYVPRLYRGEVPLTDGHFVHIRPLWVRDNYPEAYTEDNNHIYGRIALDAPVMGIPEIVRVRVAWSVEPIEIPSKDLMF